MKTKIINLVVVTGMSGAGKTVAIQSFEDIGYFLLIIFHLHWCQRLLSC